VSNINQKNKISEEVGGGDYPPFSPWSGHLWICLYICDILLSLSKIHFSINQRMSWTFARIWTFFLVHIELFFFQLFIFSSFSCSFFQSLDVSQLLLTVSASEHYMDIYIPFSKNGKNWTYKRSDISILVNYIECSSGLHRFFFYREYEYEKNRNDAPFCFFNRFIVCVPSWYFFFFFSHSVCTGYYFRKILVFFSFFCIRKGERQKSSTIIRVYVQASTVLV